MCFFDEKGVVALCIRGEGIVMMPQTAKLSAKGDNAYGKNIGENQGSKIRVKMSEEIFKLIRVSNNLNKSFFYRLRNKILPNIRTPFK